MDPILILLSCLAFLLIVFAFFLTFTLLMRARTLVIFRGAPYVASAKRSIESAFRLADLQPSDRFCDLGCGDGQVVLAAAKLGCQATGFEVDPLLVYEAKKKLRAYANAEILKQSFWDADLSKFDVIYLFQIPYAMPRLAEKLKSGCRPGTRIISNSFKFPDWIPAVSDGNIHLYIFHSTFSILS